jgi:hypothetical protein
VGPTGLDALYEPPTRPDPIPAPDTPDRQAQAALRLPYAIPEPGHPMPVSPAPPIRPPFLHHAMGTGGRAPDTGLLRLLAQHPIRRPGRHDARAPGRQSVHIGGNTQLLRLLRDLSLL